MKYRFFLVILCFFAPLLYSEELSLKETLLEAEPGSYYVIEQNKIYTFLHIYDRRGEKLTLEEVVIPGSRIPRQGINWKEWFEGGAPGNTSWVASQIDLATGKFQEAFSFTRQGWIDMSQADSFLGTLLNLRFALLSDSQRRRIGPQPTYGKSDQRAFWAPPLVVDGRRYAHVPFTAWKTRWPNDGSELSRKHVEVYLPIKLNDPTLPAYPIAFPFWIEVDGKLGSAHVRVVDSGLAAQSPKPPLPNRPVELGGVRIDEGSLSFILKTPPYFTEFLVIAEEADFIFGKTFPLRCEAFRCENDQIILRVMKEDLQQGKFRFLISPKNDPHICLQTEPFVINN